MAASDVVLTKAGGATVHECLAAGVPAVVNYVIPGQEEGNLELLERLGCGCRAPVAGGETGRFLRELVTGGRLRAMQEAATRERRPDGAVLAARRILADTPGI
jgi:processive 1,2-diacylglycerol beta-glucosyltransferase